MTAHSMPADRRPTETFPIPARGLIHTARGVRRTIVGLLRELGRRVYYAIALGRALAEPSTWGGETVRQMYYMGVGSVPLVVIVAGFLGAVTAFQTFYQLFGGVQNSVVGLISRQSIVLELGPLLTGLTLTGRVGARMTAEIGTMRVTEQIDALETLGYDPHAFLVVPRALAGVAMFPLVVGVAVMAGVGAGWGAALALLDLSSAQFVHGLRLFYDDFDVRYGLVKAASFGLAVTLIGCASGMAATGGAQGVGGAATRAVVRSAVAILVLDALWAVLWLLPRAR